MYCISLNEGHLRKHSMLRMGAGVLVLVLAFIISGCAVLKPAKKSTQVQHLPTPLPVAEPAEAAPAEPMAGLPQNWEEYRRLAALTMVERNPDQTYTGIVPQPLLGIPILRIDLNADGSIADIEVERHPKPANARETTRLAIEAVRRAAPFASVAHLPPPWQFREVFLFDGNRRFKPQVLDKATD